MGRPDKLSKEQQNALVGEISHGGKMKEVCERYGVSEITARRYWKLAKAEADKMVAATSSDLPEAA